MAQDLDGRLVLDGKVAIVTGGARGIGAAACGLLAEAGATVVVADRRAEVGEQTAQEIAERTGRTVRFRELDVTDEARWAEIVDETVADFGGVDVLVNNAGIIRVAAIRDTDDALFRKVIDTNLRGTFLGIRAVSDRMAERGGGSIINLSSPQGLEGREGMIAYTASKFGIRGLTKTAAIELGPVGIRVNVVIPGPTKTAMTARPGWTDDDYNAAYGLYPLGRMAEPLEVARMIVFLASPAASFCTGSDFVVDGGITAGKPRAN